MMKCKHIQKKLSRYQDGVTDQAEQNTIVNHLAHCDACRHVYADLQSTWELLNQLPIGSPQPFAASRIQAELEKRKAFKAHPWPARLGLAVSVTAAILFGIVAGSHWPSGSDTNQKSIDEWAGELQVQALNEIPQNSLSALYYDSQLELKGGAQ